jgi:nucleotide-binding universal stress UspA family protein
MFNGGPGVMENLNKNITIPVDGSDNSMKAIEYISNLFGPDPGLEINIIHVMSSLPSLMMDEKDTDKDVLASISRTEARQLARAKRVLEKARNQLIQRGFDKEKIKMTHRKQESGIAHEICHWARDKKTDALIVSRRGATDLEDFFFGRVSNSVVEYCKDSPVWIIAEKGFDSRKILVCIDSSENALRAAEHAGFMLAGTDCEVTLFHTLRHLSRFVPSDVLADDARLQDFWNQKAGENIGPYMQEAKELMLKAGLSEGQISLKVVDGSRSPANDIVNEARENGYATVVLGKRGVSKLKGFLFGSITRKILHNMAGLSVWIVQ